MKSRFASMIIPLIYAALVMGFVPQKNRHSQSHCHQLLQLQNQAVSEQDAFQYLHNYFQDRTFETSKNSRESQIDLINFIDKSLNINKEKSNSIDKLWRKARRFLATATLIPVLLGGVSVINTRADDELAKFAAEGHKVGVDGQCFLKKCPLETSKCANDRQCLKGLSCLARCKGGSMCSTGCFAKFGSPQLDGLLSCSVEKNDCVQVPGKENYGWKPDTLSDLPAPPLTSFKTSSMQGTWYKNMGLDSRYDCFDCQRNRFNLIDKNTIGMEALFRIPRPNFPGYLQSKIEEELHVSDPKGENPLATLQSQGQMFGLTFWENWYVLGDSKNPKMSPPLGIVASAWASVGEEKPDMKLVFYTGHTLQGSYKGAFLYSRTHTLSPAGMESAKAIIRQAGLDPMKFCKISNQCFNDPNSEEAKSEIAKFRLQAKAQDRPFWYIGQNFFSATESIAKELADWFDDPAILSDWLVSQQVKMIQEQPFAVSPFAGEDNLFN